MGRPIIKALIGWTLAGTAVAAAGLGVRRMARDDHVRRIEHALITRITPANASRTVDVTGLPEPAQRYLRHALSSNVSLPGAIRLRLTGSMAPREGAQRVEIRAEEFLAPLHGFIWTANLCMNGVSVRVQDSYADGKGRLGIELLGSIPIQSKAGPDVTRSARHRLAAEAVWCPSALLPGPEVAWEGIDSTRVRVLLTIDGEDIPLTLAIDETGRLLKVTMQRWGDVGVHDWQLIPYGFAAEAEATFDGITIPSSLSGGWWYGTERFDLAAAAQFTITDV